MLLYPAKSREKPPKRYQGDGDLEVMAEYIKKHVSLKLKTNTDGMKQSI